MGTTANQKKVFFNLRKAQRKISVFNDGDMRLDQVKIIARRIGVTETDVIYMNRRLGGDASLKPTSLRESCFRDHPTSRGSCTKGSRTRTTSTACWRFTMRAGQRRCRSSS